MTGGPRLFLGRPLKIVAADVLLVVIVAAVLGAGFDVWRSVQSHAAARPRAARMIDPAVLYDLTHGVMPADLSFPALTPASGFDMPISSWVRSGFGFGSTWMSSDGSCGDGCKYPVCSSTGSAWQHAGIDVASGEQPVHAAAGGMIVGFLDDPNWGRAVLIRHETGEGIMATLYWHVISRSGYGPGKLVARGEVFADVSPLYAHLHFAVWKGEVASAAWRGALPSTACDGWPAFPSHFVDPTGFLGSHGVAVALTR